MRRAITAISFMLFGASILIFISALLIPVLSESTSQKVISKAEVYKPSGSPEKIAKKSMPEQTQEPVALNKPDSSITQLESKVEPNDNVNDRNRKDPIVMPSEEPNITPSKEPVAMPSKEPSITSSKDSIIMPSKEPNITPSKDQNVMPSPQASPEPVVPRIHAKLPEPVKPIAAEEKRLPEHKLVHLLVLDGNSFPPGEVRPNAKAQRAINEIVPLIKAQPLDKVIVEGHADKSTPIGFSSAQAFKWNKIVSMQRAKVVAQLLKQKGVASDRIIVEGLGDAVPLASNLTWEGRSKNRRVEIRLAPVRQ
ncbi:OmpA family protein [Methylobacter sp. YRD-M1]|uniref:OmpA family protein n=1 Tax=Methylobacter sp. YRD-M1 TaxID=2911520 RepID=UPI002279F95A|nr:OmpA family protein [Methylobacter sp. YRD-M1]WAK02885.1 OmpA family protein [Methylobacter sp. YRD-M1]